MRGIKKIWNIICGMDKKLIQKICSMIASGLVLATIVSAGFMSCTPNFDTDSVSSRIDNGDRDRDDDDDDDDEDDGEKCLGHETCEEICEDIYDSGRDQVACQEEGINKVSRMDEVYSLLKKGTSRDFEKIFPDEDGVELDDLEDYLEVGISGVENLIEDTWYRSNGEGLKNVLKWIIDEQDVAEILNGLDDSGGHLILEELLDKALLKASGICIPSGVSIADNVCTANDNVSNNYNLNDSGSNAYIQVCYGTGTTVKSLNQLATNSDKMLYKALSCTYDTLSSNATDQNVFSYASRQGNNVLFEMAYELLDSICKEVDEVNHQMACRKALFCWTGAQTEATANSDFFDEYVREYRDDLEKNGGAHYDECEPSGFSDFF